MQPSSQHFDTFDSPFRRVWRHLRNFGEQFEKNFDSPKNPWPNQTLAYRSLVWTNPAIDGHTIPTTIAIRSFAATFWGISAVLSLSLFYSSFCYCCVNLSMDIFTAANDPFRVFIFHLFHVFALKLISFCVFVNCWKTLKRNQISSPLLANDNVRVIYWTDT